MSVFVQQHRMDCQFTTSESWTILSPIEQSIKRKIEAVGIPLKDWDIKIYRGILTGCNEAFIINAEKRQEILNNCRDDEERRRTDELIRPILRGRDIKRYGYNWANLFLIASHNGIPEKNIPRINIEDYPAVKQHLDQYWDKISARADKGDTPYNLRSCAYMDDFSKPKIVWAETMRIRRDNQEKFPRFSYVESSFYTDKTCFIAIAGNPFLTLSLLNSTIGRYQLSQTVSMMDNGGYLMQKIYIENIRIPNVNFNIEKRVSTLAQILLDKATPLHEQQTAEMEIDSIVFSLFNITKEEQDFIIDLCSRELGKRTVS